MSKISLSYNSTSLQELDKLGYVKILNPESPHSAVIMTEKGKKFLQEVQQFISEE